MISVPVPYRLVVLLALAPLRMQRRKIGSETHQGGGGTRGHWTATVLDSLIDTSGLEPSQRRCIVWGPFILIQI
jgi:hypothetical protein